MQTYIYNIITNGSSGINNTRRCDTIITGRQKRNTIVSFAFPVFSISMNGSNIIRKRMDAMNGST